MRLELLGEPASKSNRRRKVIDPRTGRERFIKSEKAEAYARAINLQLGVMHPKPTPFEGPVSMAVMVFYASRRPDLDVTLLQDLLEGYVYKNDRQIKELFLFWGLDKANPRVQIIANELPSETAPEEHWLRMWR